MTAWHPSSYTLRKRCRLAHEFAKSQGVSLSKLALAFSTSRPLVSTTLVSASSLEVLESNAKVVNPTLHHSKSDEAFKDALQHTSSGADTPEGKAAGAVLSGSAAAPIHNPSLFRGTRRTKPRGP